MGYLLGERLLNIVVLEERFLGKKLVVVVTGFLLVERGATGRMGAVSPPGEVGRGDGVLGIVLPGLAPTSPTILGFFLLGIYSSFLFL